MEPSSTLSKILIGFAITALTAMGAGVIRHEVGISTMSRDVVHIRELLEKMDKKLDQRLR